jgi:hypothetical protein
LVNVVPRKSPRFGITKSWQTSLENGGFCDVTELPAAPAVINYQLQERAMPQFVLSKDPIFPGLCADHVEECARG